MLTTRLFVDEDGSTLLAAMLAVVLSITMLATGLQWYWVGSSSCDIQSVADLGALAGADAIAKTVTVIQVLDFLLLSMNVVAIVLHVVVIVSGIVVVTSTPVGGTSMAPIFQKALEFDRKFINLRKRFANEAYTIASMLSAAAPFLAMGQSYRVVSKNSGTLSSRVGTNYAGVAIPFPAQGEVTLSSMPPNEAELATVAGTANESNSNDARRLAELEDRLDQARKNCWDADIYRPSATPYYGWSPASAITDFGNRLKTLGDSVPSVELPGSIGGTGWSDNVLSERYRADYLDIGQTVRSRFGAIAGNKANGYLDPGEVTPSYLLEPALTTSVQLVAHVEGERKAYHSTASCSGLSNAAAQPQLIEVGQLVGDYDHPPCSLCTPTHWAAIQEWSTSLGHFTTSWNTAAVCIQNYEAIREEMAELKDSLTAHTTDALEEILDNAASYLRGGRLTYRPAGSRGLVCVVTSTSSRTLPAFTLPAVTGAKGRVLGKQVALAGAKLSSGGGGSAAAQAVDKLSAEVGAGKPSNVSGSVLVTLGLSDGVAGAVAPLWRSGVTSLRGNSTSLKTTFDSLPWGIGGVVRKFMDTLVEEAGLSKPDLRQVIPVLASVSDIGDPDAPDWEGQFASMMTDARSAYGGSRGLAEAMEALVGAGQSAGAGSTGSLVGIEEYRLMGRPFRVPFDDWSALDGFRASGWALGGLGSILDSR